MQNSIELINDAFSLCLDDDYFSHLYNRGSLAPSIRDFIQDVVARHCLAAQTSSRSSLLSDFTDLTIKFSDFQKLGFDVNGRTEVIASMLRNDFCTASVAPLARKVAIDRDESPALEEAFAEVGADSWETWGEAMARPDCVEKVSAVLSETMIRTLADRTLLSFFIRPPKVAQFSMVGVKSYSGYGRPLPTHVTTHDEYSVEIRVAKYDEVVCGVIAHEWMAKLTLAGASQDDAAACGMVYVFKRVKGTPTGDKDDLIFAADSIADDDVLQAQSFLDQHEDSSQVIEQSDLAFVWLWERREGTEKGLGAKCLVAAVDDLKRRFKRVKTVIPDARPAQFADWGSELEPAMVVTEKRTAVDSLVSYIKSLPLNTEVRPISNQFRNPHKDALMALHNAVASFKTRA
jgi:hypothetical protein